ncbi:hypothetical protein ACERII_18040 [Evansella sp. AB-rgal1]|uniref:hypothetical protein n=1 Tax=Evansella sp. AB-rgal1 TaxID=3242696 RepID=UPI00359E6D0D
MKKTLVLLLCLLFLIVSCNSQERDDYDFEGITLGVHDLFNVLTVFVEDNLGGNEVILQGWDPSSFKDYEVEAYQVFLTKDTKIINEGSGEELQMVSRHEFFSGHSETVASTLLFHPYRKVAVKVEETFSSSVSSNRSNYIMYDRSFLPIYRAKEVRLFPLTFNDFVLTNTVHIQPDEISITAVYDPSTDNMNNYYFDYDKLWNSLISSQDPSAYVTFQTWEVPYFEQYHPPSEYQQYPIFFILNEDGLLYDTHDWDDAAEYVESVIDK